VKHHSLLKAKVIIRQFLEFIITSNVFQMEKLGATLLVTSGFTHNDDLILYEFVEHKHQPLVI